MWLVLLEFIICLQIYHSSYTFEIHNLSVFYWSFYVFTESSTGKRRNKIKNLCKVPPLWAFQWLYLLQRCVWVGILEKKKEKKKKIREKLILSVFFLLFLINPTRRHFTFQMVFHRTFKEITIDHIVTGYLKKHSDWLQLFAGVSFSQLHDQITVILINIGFLVSYSSVQVFYFYITSHVHHTCL